MDRRISLGKNASGRVTIATFSWWRAVRIRLALSFRYKMSRTGKSTTATPDEAIYRNFERGPVLLHAGWDNWSGFYWSAANAEADTFLEQFHERHCG